MESIREQTEIADEISQAIAGDVNALEDVSEFYLFTPVH